MCGKLGWVAKYSRRHPMGDQDSLCWTGKDGKVKFSLDALVGVLTCLMG